MTEETSFISDDVFDSMYDVDPKSSRPVSKLKQPHQPQHRSATAAALSQPTTRSATAFDLKRHMGHRSVYTPTANYAVRRKFANLNGSNSFRSKSTVNHSGRSYSTHSVLSKTPLSTLGETTVMDDVDEEENFKPNRSFLTLLRIGLFFFGIELMFSMETALTVPILLKLKVSEQVYSLVYFVSPLIGFVLQPVLGVLSDRCESRFGRRRPFILILGLGAYVGITCILNNQIFGQYLGDNNRTIPTAAIILVGLGVTFLDFCADSSDSPLRAFLLDVCNTKDQDTGLNLHAFLGGIGSAMGFILAAIDWSQTFFSFIGNDLLILFVFTSIIFILTLTATLTSVSETPIKLSQNENLPLISKKKFLTDLPEEIEDNTQIETKPDPVEDDNDDPDKPITLQMLFKSIIIMPTELVRLLICQLFGWLALFSTILFFTDFIAQSVYLGDPAALVNSTSINLYNEGVKMGCWCLLNYSVSSALSAVVLEKFLMTRFSTKAIYFFCYLFYALCCSAMYYTANIFIILPLCSSFGIILTALTTLPYQMLSEFHEDPAYRAQSAPGTKRGIGVDCSLLSSCYFFAQCMVAAFMSFLTAWMGNYSIVIVAALFALLGCFWISCFVIFPEETPPKKEIDT